MKSVYPVFYKVSFWNGQAEEQARGITFASTPIEATEKLSSYYGANNISSFKVLMLEETCLMELTRDMWTDLLESMGGKEDL